MTDVQEPPQATQDVELGLPDDSDEVQEAHSKIANIEIAVAGLKKQLEEVRIELAKRHREKLEPSKDNLAILSQLLTKSAGTQENLVRQVLKLDSVESHGNSNVRSRRKAAVLSVNAALDMNEKMTHSASEMVREMEAHMPKKSEDTEMEAVPSDPEPQTKVEEIETKMAEVSSSREKAEANLKALIDAESQSTSELQELHKRRAEAEETLNTIAQQEKGMLAKVLQAAKARSQAEQELEALVEVEHNLLEMIAEIKREQLAAHEKEQHEKEVQEAEREKILRDQLMEERAKEKEKEASKDTSQAKTEDQPHEVLHKPVEEKKPVARPPARLVDDGDHYVALVKLPNVRMENIEFDIVHDEHDDLVLVVSGKSDSDQDFLVRFQLPRLADLDNSYVQMKGDTLLIMIPKRAPKPVYQPLFMPSPFDGQSFPPHAHFGDPFSPRFMW